MTITPALPIMVTISPASITLAPGSQQQFSAAVTNATSTQVTWSANVGSITAAGMFTAPSASSSVPATITAISQADPSKTGAATVTITALPSTGTMLLETSRSRSVYIDPGTTATSVLAYSDSNNHPGTLLTNGRVATLQKATWDTINVPPISISAGSKYWFALLGTGGSLRFRQRPIAGGWIDELSAVTTLTSLPATWTTGAIYTGGALTSTYGSGGLANTAAISPPVATPTTPPATTPTAAPLLAVSQSTLSFNEQAGASSLSGSGVGITNSGRGTLTYTAVSDQPWLVLSNASGTAPSTVQVTASVAALKAGTYAGHITFVGRWSDESGERGSNRGQLRFRIQFHFPGEGRAVPA